MSKKGIINLVTTFWFLPMAILVPAAMAQDTPAENAVKETPIFAIIDWYPFGWVDEERKPQGLMVDIVEYVMNALNTKAIIEISPVPRVLKNLDTGDIDFTVVYNDPVMVPNAEFWGTIGCLYVNLVPVKGSGIRSIDGIVGKRIGLPTKGYFDMNYSDKYEFIHVEVARNRQLFLLGERDRVDAIVINDAVWDGFHNTRDPEYRLADEIWSHFEVPIMTAPILTSFAWSGDPRFNDLAKRIHQFTFEAYYNGEFEQFYRKYGVRSGGYCPEELNSDEKN